MKKAIIIGMLFILSACSTMKDSEISTKNYFSSEVSTPDLVSEHWANQLQFNPDNWLKNTDSWYTSGSANRIEQDNNTAPIEEAISTIHIKAGNFTKLILAGTFHVQIVGGQETNSVYISGPNAETQQIIAQVHQQTLTIQQQTDYSSPDDAIIPTHDIKDLLGIPTTAAKNVLNHVIVRIGIQQLTGLTTSGWIQVEGKQILAQRLNLFAADHTKILLSGKLNIAHIKAKNASDITMLGVYTPAMDINASDMSNINLAGRVGIDSIHKTGNGNIKIKGADSNHLTIHHTGSGTIAILGSINLTNLTASDDSKTYLAHIMSKAVSIDAKNRAIIGLAGLVNEANINLAQFSRLNAQQLDIKDLYIKTINTAHANVKSSNKTFASAFNNSSIYFFGPETILTPYIRDNGVILPINKQ